MHNAVVVNPRAEREAGSGCLRYPPESPHQTVIAGHHAVPDKVHHGRAHLRGSVHRIRVCERAQQRITFCPITAGNRAPRGPRINCGSTAPRAHQRVPDFALPWRFDRAINCGLDGRVAQWLAARTNPLGGSIRSIRIRRLGRGHIWEFRIGCRDGLWRTRIAGDQCGSIRDGGRCVSRKRGTAKQHKRG